MAEEPPVVCTICLELPTNPLTTPCGHNFCQVCFNTWLARSSTATCSCPSCNSTIPRTPISVNIALRDMLAIWAQMNKYNVSKEPIDNDKNIEVRTESTHQPYQSSSISLPPNPTATTQLGMSSTVCTSGLHQLIISTYASGEYAHGWMCNMCQRSHTGARWFCKACSEDICFECKQPTAVRGNNRNRLSLGSHVMSPFDIYVSFIMCILLCIASSEDLQLPIATPTSATVSQPKCTLSRHAMTLVDHGWWSCDICYARKRGRRWRCEMCNEDFCFQCRRDVSMIRGALGSSGATICPSCDVCSEAMTVSTYAFGIYGR